MEIKSYIENNKKKFLDELFELIRIPSISAIKEYDKELRWRKKVNFYPLEIELKKPMSS